MPTCVFYPLFASAILQALLSFRRDGALWSIHPYFIRLDQQQPFKVVGFFHRKYIMAHKCVADCATGFLRMFSLEYDLARKAVESCNYTILTI